MSNEERLVRSRDQKKRKFWIKIQVVAILAVLLLAIVSSLLCLYFDRTYYINYDESSNVDYKVYLKANDFYEDEYLEKGQAYVASLIDSVSADFKYELQMESKNVDYEYSYKVDAQLEIKDSKYNIAIYNPIYNIKEEQTLTQNSSSNLKINEQVTIDYDYYNDIANKFITTYGLSNTVSSLNVKVHINVISACEDFEEDNQGEYVIALNIPLTNKTVNIEINSSVPSAESKILACPKSPMLKGTFNGLAIMFLVIDIALGVCLFAYTRNNDISYELQVKKLVLNYKSYIQKINNEFDTNGYQVLKVNSFNEMLEIRDTIQSPILMSENLDKTCTRFVIPTNSKILYMFEIIVKGYEDEAEYVVEPASKKEKVKKEEKQEVVEEPIVEQIEEVVETTDEIEEPVAPVAVVADDDDDDDGDGTKDFSTKTNYSFEAKLSLAENDVKDYYKDIVKFAKSYGVKVSRSWKKERIYFGRDLFAVLTFKGKSLCAGLPLRPEEFKDSKYRFVDMSAYKKYQETPFLIKVTSSLKVRHLYELLEALFENAGLKNKKISVGEVEIGSKTKEELIEAGLIKVPNKN